MGNDDKNSSGEGAGGIQIFLFFCLAALVALGVLVRALLPWIEKCLQFYTIHRGQIRACCYGLLLAALPIAAAALWNRHLNLTEESYVTAEDEGSVYLGIDVNTGEAVHLKDSIRITHAEAIGTTFSGKTSSFVFPLIVSDMEQGRGCIIVDGKSDREFIDKLYAQAVRTGRVKDLMIFSLAEPHLSSTFNPFCQGTPDQIAERVFSAFNITDPYYGGVQFSALRAIIALLMRRGQTPMPGTIRECLRDKKILQGWLPGLKDKNLSKDIKAILADETPVFLEKYSGLVTQLGHFSQGETLPLFNSKHPEIILSDVLKQGKICYFQLPTMLNAQLATVSGKLLLQCLQSAISERQVSGDRLKSLFSIYLDDFNDYIYDGFASLLNKSRSANIGVVFSHQSLGDLEKVSPNFKQTVMTNTNIKVIMSSNDPDSAEHFAKMIGTRTTEKTTERRRKSFFGRKENTGDQSVRETEEYIVHPNVFKSELGQGEGIMVIPHTRGRVVKRVKFRMADPLPVLKIPIRDLPVMDITAEATSPEAKEEKAVDPLETVKTEVVAPEKKGAVTKPEEKT